MTKMTNKRLCVILMLLITVLFSFFAVLKSDLYIDETYSYCMSNGVMPPFFGASNSIKGDSVIDKVITRQEFYDLVSASDNKFDYKNVNDNLLTDVHPPLYGFMLHTVSSLFDGGGKYKALALDFIIYILTLFFLYKLAKRLFGSDMIALITVILYGLSHMGMSNAIMIRMYVLLTLFTVLVTYIVVLILQTDKRYLYPIFSLVIFLGLYTQYYFAIYAGILSAGACIYLLIKKQYKKLICFVIFGLLGIGIMCLAFPNILYVLIFKKQGMLSGQQAVNSLLQAFGDQEAAMEQKAVNPNNLNPYLKLILFAGFASVHMLIASLVGIASVVLTIKNGNRKDVLHFLRKEQSVHLTFIVIVSTFISMFLIAIICPYAVERYIYHICPLFALTAGFAVYVLQSATDKKTFVQKSIFPLVLMVLSVALLIIKVPKFVYPEYREYNKMIDEYSDSPCIYLEENDNAPISSDLPQLMKFNDVFVTNDTNSEAMKDYLKTYGDPDTVIVFIDTYEKRLSRYDPDEKLTEFCENTEYNNYEKLFSSEFISEAYKVSK